MFCAVGLYSAVSDDGITWNQSASSIDTVPNHYSGIAYGNQMLVTIFDGGDNWALRYSTDGLTWAGSDTPTLSAYRGLVTGAMTFALTKPTMTYTPVDGIHNATIATYDWQSITFGNSQFCMVSAAGGHCAVSNDGINWTLGTISVPSGHALFATYALSQFFAFSQTSSHYSTSADGLYWTENYLDTTHTYQGAATNGTVLAVLVDNTRVLLTTDSINWYTITLPTRTDWRAIACDNGLFCVVSYAGNLCATSIDGFHWTTHTMPTNNWLGIASTNPYKLFWDNFVDTHEDD